MTDQFLDYDEGVLILNPEVLECGTLRIRITQKW
jgi:hypothetical protein